MDKNTIEQKKSRFFQCVLGKYLFKMSWNNKYYDRDLDQIIVNPSKTN